MGWTWIVLPGAIIWLAVIVLPWRPWLTREFLDSRAGQVPGDLSDITALIPARNEALHIARTLQALASQGVGLRIVLVDDESADGTAEAAVTAGVPGLLILQGEPMPQGWTGKLWALEQGRGHVTTPLILLLDADIELRPGILATLVDKMRTEDLQLLSLMAQLRMLGFWERLLLPAFVHFFKLVYPFQLVNDPDYPGIGAAAGGCILIDSRVLSEGGGFGAIRGALIDDCALATRVKSRGHRIWLGLTHSVRSLRAYPGLASIWNMVARTAFTQLRYSPVLLAGVTGLFVLSYWLPLAGVLFPDAGARSLAAFALGAMLVTYMPTLAYYGQNRVWALAIPLVATLFLAMTWSSALRYWGGERSRWKDRVYRDAA
jgi:hopene-associated glycosyltransferase HpnB